MQNEAYIGEFSYSMLKAERYKYEEVFETSEFQHISKELV